MYKIFELNPQLLPYAADIDLRMQLYKDTRQMLLGDSGEDCTGSGTSAGAFFSAEVDGRKVYRPDYDAADADSAGQRTPSDLDGGPAGLQS